MSVGWVNESTRGCEWWMSPQRVAANAAASVAGCIRWSSPPTPRSSRPPPIIDVAAASLLRMCAVSWQSTAPHGGHIELSASALAAVPLVTGKTRAPGCSNTARAVS